MAAATPGRGGEASLRQFLAKQWPVDDPDSANEITDQSWAVAEKCLDSDAKLRDEITGGLALRVASSAMRHNGIHRAFTAPERLTMLVQEAFRPGPQRAFAIKCVNNAVVTDPTEMARLATSSYAYRLFMSLDDEPSALTVRAATDSLRVLLVRSPELKEDMLRSPPAATAVMAGLLAELLLRGAPPLPLGGSHRGEAAVACLRLLFVIGPDLLAPTGKVHPVARESDAAGVKSELTDIDRLGLVLIAIAAGAASPATSAGSAPRPKPVQPAFAVPAQLTIRSLAAQCLMHAPPAIGGAILQCGALRGLVDLVSSLCLAAITARSRLNGVVSGTSSHGTRFGVRIPGEAALRAKKDEVDQQLWAALLLVRHFAADCKPFCDALKVIILPTAAEKPVNGDKVGSAHLSGNHVWMRLMQAAQLGTDRIKRASMELVLVLVDGSARELTDKVGVAMAFPILHAKGALGTELQL